MELAANFLGFSDSWSPLLHHYSPDICLIFKLLKLFWESGFGKWVGWILSGFLRSLHSPSHSVCCFCPKTVHKCINAQNVDGVRRCVVLGMSCPSVGSSYILGIGLLWGFNSQIIRNPIVCLLVCFCLGFFFHHVLILLSLCPSRAQQLRLLHEVFWKSSFSVYWYLQILRFWACGKYFSEIFSRLVLVVFWQMY